MDTRGSIRPFIFFFVKRPFIFFTNIFWIQALHPSALDMFDKIMSDAEGKQIIMFLDYDGTLSQIIEDHDNAYVTDEVYFY